MHELTKEELNILKKLDTPHKIQIFLDNIPRNFEPNGDTCMSPRKVLRENRCHCIEGAMLAYTAFLVQNKEAFLLDLTASSKDFDHVIVIFKEEGHWGAISKSNYAVLRYREPVYKSIRELVMSYFNEYIDKVGNKTLRSYSKPVNLKKIGYKWITSEENVWEVPYLLIDTKHYPIINKKQIKKLKKADPIEVVSSEMKIWNPNAERLIEGYNPNYRILIKSTKN
jgi:hypothetical protein